MSYLITKDKVRPLYLLPLCIMTFLLMGGPVITAQAATFPDVPADPSTYTKKAENYNPEYEYCLYQVYSALPSLGHDSTMVTVPGFVGTEDEAKAFGKYIYQYYDYTAQLKVSCSTTAAGSQLYNLHIQFDDPGQIYEMQMTAEQKLYNFSQSLIGLSDLDKIIRTNNWIASNARYDESLQKTSCYSNIIEGTSTCNGYTRAFHAVCSYSGIKCENVRGYVGDQLHIWNKVFIDNTWKYVDVTWNSMSNSSNWLLVSKDKLSGDYS